MLGDLVLDVVLAPARQLAPSSDVPGRVALVQGGSAANTARWVARLGARSSLIAAVGRDVTGSRARRGAPRGRGGAPCLTDRRRQDRAHRRARGAGRRAELRPGSRCSRAAGPGRPADVLVRRGGRGPPADLLAARSTGTGRASRTRTGPSRGRRGQHRPGVDPPAAGRRPSGGPLTDRGDGARPPVRHRCRGRGAARAHRPGRPPPAGLDRGRQARRQGRHGAGPRRQWNASFRCRHRDAQCGRHDRCGRRLRCRASSSAGWPRGRPDGRDRRRSIARRWPGIGPRPASCRRRARSWRSADAAPPCQARRWRSNQSSIRVIRSIRRSGRPDDE